MTAWRRESGRLVQKPILPLFLPPINRPWWRNGSGAGFFRLTDVVLTQTEGSKHTASAAFWRPVTKDHVLMIGDAPGDHQQAALQNSVCFYPILVRRRRCPGSQFGKRRWSVFRMTGTGGRTRNGVLRILRRIWEKERTMVNLREKTLLP